MFAGANFMHVFVQVLWGMFANIWNAIILELRERDLMSDQQAHILKFEPMPNLTSSQIQLMPRSVAAGQIQAAVTKARLDHSHAFVLTHAYDWLIWMFQQVGFIKPEEVSLIQSTSCHGYPWHCKYDCCCLDAWNVILAVSAACTRCGIAMWPYMRAMETASI